MPQQVCQRTAAMRSHDDVVTVKRLGTLNDAVGHGPDVLMHFIRDPGGIQQAARRPQGIFALSRAGSPWISPGATNWLTSPRIADWTLRR
jgi:hypothetical protein